VRAGSITRVLESVMHFASRHPRSGRRLHNKRGRTTRVVACTVLSASSLRSRPNPLRTADTHSAFPAALNSDSNRPHQQLTADPGEEHRVLDLPEAVRRDGFFVRAIRYRTVPRGAAHLRITISAANSSLQLASLGNAIARLASHD
jgi:7-keto-8-aminopelargonate synthetase-like enzyme